MSIEKPVTLLNITDIRYSKEMLELQNQMLSIIDAFCIIFKELYIGVKLTKKSCFFDDVALFDDSGKVILDKYPLMFSEMSLYCLRGDIFDNPKYIDLHERITLGQDFLKDELKAYILIQMIEIEINYESYKDSQIKSVNENAELSVRISEYLTETKQEELLEKLKQYFILSNSTMLKDNLIEHSQENFDEVVHHLMSQQYSQENAMFIASMLPVEHLIYCYNYEIMRENILYEMEHGNTVVE